MYYHVDMWHHFDRALILRSANLDWALVRDRVLPAYRGGGSLTLDGHTVDTSIVGVIRILETDEKVNPATPYDDDYLRELGWTYSTEERDITNQWITGPPGQGTIDGEEPIVTLNQEQDVHPSIDAREVFVVHGRNGAARDAMFTFLRALELHPLEWSELVNTTGQGSPYIGDVLDVAFSRAHAVVVLMTPDDEVRLREQFRHDNEPDEAEFKGQARPNVLFEAGRAFGRHAHRTILVEIGNLRPFSDVVGRHVIKLHDNAESRHAIAQRLKTAGCPANTEGTDWLSAGEFAAAIKLAEASAADQAVGFRTPSNVFQEPEATGISSDAAEILLAVAGSNSGRLLKVSTTGGTIIKAQAHSFGELGNPRSEARWKSALDELLSLNLMRHETGNSFEVTHNGFVFADSLKTE